MFENQPPKNKRKDIFLVCGVLFLFFVCAFEIALLLDLQKPMSAELTKYPAKVLGVGIKPSFQGPVPEGYDEQHFRETGITKPLQDVIRP